MESGTGRALFISYAREDTDAARRIADALRAFGHEVWFDQSELRGGDAWDAKIRKQIRECALFVPVISAQSQARHEGYFRREWKLAVERTHDMAAGVAFIVPVVVDETTEAEALVPEEFLRYQWTHLLHGVPTPEFVNQVKRLLESPRGKGVAQASSLPSAGTGGQSAGGLGRRSAPPRRAMPGWARGALGLVVLGGLAGAYFALRRPAPAPRISSAAASSLTPSSLTPSRPAAPNSKSIAVLPFENMSADKNNAYFCDGIQEDILTNLGNIKELRVVSRTSVEQYRNTTKPIRQIARELGVKWILEGSVQREGNKVRVTGQLINAATDEHVWAKAYDRNLTDIFAIQSELAQTIATSLQATVSPQEKNLIDERPTDNVEAYELVLKARQIRTSTTYQTSEDISLLEEAVKLDPHYAAAYADLAYQYSVLFGNFGSVATAGLAKAKAAIDTAVRLAPDSPDVMRGLGDYYYYALGDYPRALAQYARVAQVRPNDPELLNRIASIQRRQGHWLESLATFQKLQSVDPGNMHNERDLAILLCAGRRFDEATAAIRRAAELRPEILGFRFGAALLPYLARGSTSEMEGFFASLPPAEARSDEGLTFRRVWAMHRGDLDEAIRLDKVAPAQGWGLVGVAMAYRLRGEQGIVAARLAKLAADIRVEIDTGKASFHDWTLLGDVEAVLGHKEEALRWARKACELVPESKDALFGAETRANLALVLAWTGETDAAIDEYARLLRTPFGSIDGGGGQLPSATVADMKHDVLYAPLRGNPRFEALLKDPKNNAPLF